MLTVAASPIVLASVALVSTRPRASHPHGPPRDTPTSESGTGILGAVLRVAVASPVWLDDEDVPERLSTKEALARIAARAADASVLLNLRGADLMGVNLRYVILRDADLREANLTDANLESANLTDANLESANLTHANLTGAILTGVSGFGGSPPA